MIVKTQFLTEHYLFLSRAVVVAAPAGLIIWLIANISVDGMTILNITSNFLDPLLNALVTNGVILLAFILGFPANEIVIPIMIMAYLASGSLIEMDNLVMLKKFISKKMAGRGSLQLM